MTVYVLMINYYYYTNVFVRFSVDEVYDIYSKKETAEAELAWLEKDNDDIWVSYYILPTLVNES